MSTREVSILKIVFFKQTGNEDSYKYVGGLNNRGLHPCRVGEADVEKEILNDGAIRSQEVF